MMGILDQILPFVKDLKNFCSTLEVQIKPLKEQQNQESRRITALSPIFLLSKTPEKNPWITVHSTFWCLPINMLTDLTISVKLHPHPLKSCGQGNHLSSVSCLILRPVCCIWCGGPQHTSWHPGRIQRNHRTVSFFWFDSYLNARQGGTITAVGNCWWQIQSVNYFCPPRVNIPDGSTLHGCTDDHAVKHSFTPDIPDDEETILIKSHGMSLPIISGCT